MATCCNPNGVTIIEVDEFGAIMNTTTGYGQGWRQQQQPTQKCGSPEWLSEIALTPDPATMQTVIKQVAANGGFKGLPTCGTSWTTCQRTVFLNPPHTT